MHACKVSSVERCFLMTLMKKNWYTILKVYCSVAWDWLYSRHVIHISVFWRLKNVILHNRFHSSSQRSPSSPHFCCILSPRGCPLAMTLSQWAFLLRKWVCCNWIKAFQNIGGAPVLFANIMLLFKIHLWPPRSTLVPSFTLCPCKSICSLMLLALKIQLLIRTHVYSADFIKNFFILIAKILLQSCSC